MQFHWGVVLMLCADYGIITSLVSELGEAKWGAGLLNRQRIADAVLQRTQ